MLGDHAALLDRHEIFLLGMRTAAEILDAGPEFFDKIWYVRSLIRSQKIEDGTLDDMPPELRKTIMAARARPRQKYGRDNVGPWDDWHWGYVHGHLSALRWVLGDDFDFLDT